MPLNIIDFTRAPLVNYRTETPDYSYISNFIPNAFRSYQDTLKTMAMPKTIENEQRMAEEKLKQLAFENALEQQYGARGKEADIASKLAYAALVRGQTAHLGDLPGLMGQIQGLQRFKLGTPAHALAERALESQIVGKGGLNETYNIVNKLNEDRENAIEEYGEDSAQVKNIDKMINNALSLKGSKVPAAVATQNINANIANTFRQYFAEHEFPIIGSGSILDMRKAVMNYNKTKDPMLFEKLVQSGLMAKLVPEYAGAALVAARQRDTVSARKHHEKAITQGWPESYKVEVNNFPPEVQREVNKRHQQTLQDLTDIGQQQYESALSGTLGSQSRNIGNSPTSYSPEDLEFTAKKYGISVPEVKRRLGIK